MDTSLYENILSSKKTNYKKIISFALMFIIFIWAFVGISGPNVPEGGLEIAKNIFVSIFTPSLDLIFSLDKQSVLYLLLETAMIAFLGTLIGAVISLFIAFLGASNLMPNWFTKIIRLLLSIIRTIPALVYGLMVIKMTGPGPMAGVVTFSIVSIGMISKLYIEEIEEISKGLKETAQVAGFSWFKTVRLVVFPQVFNGIVSTVIYRFEINLRDASILGLIGAGGLGTPINLAMAEQRWHDVGAYLLGLIILVLIVEFVSTKVRAKLTRG